MKYKVGDKVRIRKRDVPKYPDEHLEFLKKNDYVGIIKKVNPSNDGYYKFKGGNDSLWWSKGCIIGIEPEPIPIDSRFEILDL